MLGVPEQILKIVAVPPDKGSQAARCVSGPDDVSPPLKPKPRGQHHGERNLSAAILYLWRAGHAPKIEPPGYARLLKPLRPKRRRPFRFNCYVQPTYRAGELSYKCAGASCSAPTSDGISSPKRREML
jgi:hypothetical protein